MGCWSHHYSVVLHSPSELQFFLLGMLVSLERREEKTREKKKEVPLYYLWVHDPLNNYPYLTASCCSTMCGRVLMAVKFKE